jgi:CAAX prenyl protease-like protein
VRGEFRMALTETGSSSPNAPHPNPLPEGEGVRRGEGANRCAPGSFITDDAAYFLPMAVFLVFTWAGGHWPKFYVASYVLKTLITASLLILFRRHYAKIRWNYWWLGILLGIVGVFQWVGMENALLHLWPNYPRPSGSPLDPTKDFSSPLAMWSFFTLRWAAASLMVPVMEELFWRDFGWRSVAAPADFKLAKLGEWDRGIPFIIVTLVFASVHVEWMTAIVWGLMIGGLLIYTRSLGACIIMHAVTNFLLGAYVLYSHDWKFW